MRSSVKFHQYNGEKAVTMSFGRYTAMILPDIGGNLVSFVDTERNLNFLRTPQSDEMMAFKSYPVVYGIPVLFPPNRYQDGTFTFNGREYRFPINEIDTNNHLHGFLYDLPWHVDVSGTSEAISQVMLFQEVDHNHPIYQFWPHHFKITICYRLSDEGLQQEVRVRNIGGDCMPLMLAFHTTLNVPFSPESTRSDYTCAITIGDRWELSKRMLPTGNFQALTSNEEQLKGDGISPFFEPMDNHYVSLPQDGRNYMALTDRRLGLRLIYNVGRKYNNWMIWNNNAEGSFFCPEPQTNVVNAPNTTLSDEESGMVVLEPGQSWFETSRFSIEYV
ncbi:aldose 1-epimerase [Alicyclobacillus tolerans]|uniref:aldose 1-epimerase n=1 Tax=Alicyclobacillus tolerans TaxID=90970 RepID=UPI001F3B4E09|nr:aldose 1-epimerase [Alicyclobacillus tolerans]MCF8567327.1 aldose 1-epimerase [Alicyclobacillus tolerans]